MLRLEYRSLAPNEGEEKNAPRLYTPDSGGQMLLTGRSAATQIPHLDFLYREEGIVGEGLMYPGYFIVTTGSEGAVLWVVYHSHNEIFVP